MHLRNKDVLNTTNNLNSCDDSDALSTTENCEHTNDFEKSLTHLLLKQLLARKIFVGEYSEKRYVTPLKCYRDIIIIDEDEKDVITRLCKVKEIASKYYNNKWIGITTDWYNDVVINHCLWVELDQLPLGKYWFKVQSIIIRDEEIILKVKQIRPYETKKKLNISDISNFGIDEFFNWSNFWEMIRFVIVLLVTIITGLINALPHIADYILRFMKEVNNMIQALTPIILGCLEVVSRSIGGLYWMVILLFRNPGPVQQRMPKYPAIAPMPRQNNYKYQNNLLYR